MAVKNSKLRLGAFGRVFALAAASVLVVGGVAAEPAAAAADTTSPTLTSLILTPTSVNITSADAVVMVQMQATDNSSGVASGCIAFDKPGSTVPYNNSACFSAANRIAGNALNGTYRFPVTFRHFAHTGFYNIDLITLKDAAGNLSAISGALLQVAGYPYRVQVSGTPDLTAPTLESVAFSATTGDLADGDFTTTVTAHLTDLQSGYDVGCINFSSPAPGPTAVDACVFDPSDRISGTPQDGIYQATVTIPATNSPGVYSLTGAELQDDAQNFVDLTPAQVESKGAPAALVMTNRFETPPTAPSGVVAMAANGSAVVSWIAPLSDGGAPIIGYTATASPGGQSVTVGVTHTSATLTGLTNDTTYTITVHATNGLGDGPESDPSNAVTPEAPPDAPTGVQAVAGAGQAQVTWTPPLFDGGSPILGYTVTETPVDTFGCGPAGPICQTASVGPNVTTATVSGLENGKGYTFTVRARNAIGDGALSTPSAAVTTAPGTATAPQYVDVTVVGTRALVQWTVPANNGGSPITSYTATATPGGQTVTVLASNPSRIANFTGLTVAAPYTFTVHATNSYGDGPESPASAPVVPYGPPNSPTAVHAVAGDGTATVSWTAPNSNGAPLTQYFVTASPGGAIGSADPPQTTAVVHGLTNGVTYTFTVVAANIGGESSPSVASSAVTSGTPTAPGAPTATPSDTTATVRWTAPVDNGSPITGYVVTPYSGFVALAPRVFNSTATTQTISGLTNNTTYRFTVAARNANGLGVTSQTAAVKIGIPRAPTLATATPANAAATVRWTAPPSPTGAPVTGYVITPYLGTVAQPARTFATAATTEVVTGLTNGAAYTFAVAAKNANGIGPQSNRTAAVSAGAPLAPTGAGAVAGAATSATGPVTVSYTAAANNGAPFTKFTATCISTNGGAPVSGAHVGPTVAKIVVAGATTAKTYTCTVTAMNSRGTSAASSPSLPVIVGAPAAPTTPTAVRVTAGSLRVAFAAPAANGSPITSYTATCRSSNGGVTRAKVGAASPITLTGLSAGKSYQCTVTATNARGAGPSSAPSAPATA